MLLNGIVTKRRLMMKATLINVNMRTKGTIAKWNMMLNWTVTNVTMRIKETRRHLTKKTLTRKNTMTIRDK
jgi:hypothetical protein